jgi:surfactin synthase thioesterase subunit
MSTARAWFPYRKGSSGIELFAFPHAGAGSTVFKYLREDLSGTGITAVPAVLPGRERRLAETPYKDMSSLLVGFEEMAREDGYAAFMDDYALLGHCSGALVAYEIARLLERGPCRDPRLLVACSCPPPPRVRNTGMSELSTEELFRRTASMGGTPDRLMTNPDFLEMVERPLRADWVLFDGYVHEPTPKLSTPILAVRGVSDPDIRPGDLELWRDETDGGFATTELQSGHWALTEAGSAELAQAVQASLYAAEGT